MKAIIKQVEFQNEWSNENGTFYAHKYILDDNGKEVTLSANHKSRENAFKPGDEVEYEIRGSSKYGDYGSVSKPKEDFKKNYQKTPADYRAFAVAYAKDFYVGQIEPKMKSNEVADKVRSMFLLAKRIDDYIQTGEIPKKVLEKTISVPDKSPEPPSQDMNVELAKNPEDDDLPF